MDEGTQMIRLHLGCGKRNWEGWTNVDLADFPHIHHKQDVRDLSNFEDGCVAMVYASHVLEYYDREEAKSVLQEWKRVLIPGGVIRVAVPDFLKLILVYNLGGLDDILGPLYGKMEVDGKHIYHKTVYDFFSLRDVLEEAGFKDIRWYDWKVMPGDDHSRAHWPHDPEAIRTGKFNDDAIRISLNVEGTK
jgi:predicted SAM-dependent methyltransferase